MIVLGIDPGPTCSGVVAYDAAREEVIGAMSDCSLDKALDLFRGSTFPPIGLVAVERVQSYGIAGADLLRTSEVVGRLQQRALDSGLRVALLYRRDVLRHLDVAGKGSHDARVRQRLIEMFGGARALAVGTKRDPGPLWGVTGHAWQALAVAVTASASAPDPFLAIAEQAGLGCAGDKP